MWKAIWLSIFLSAVKVASMDGFVQTEDIKMLSHDVKSDDIDPVWMNPGDGDWVIGFARDNKTDRTQELGYWEIYSQLGGIMFSAGKRGYMGPLGKIGPTSDYRFFSGYLCWAPSKPYKRLAYINNYRELKILSIENLEAPDTLITLEFQVNNLYLDWSVRHVAQGDSLEYLAFVSELTGQGDIYVVQVPQKRVGKVKGNELSSYIKRLTTSSVHDGQPSWSPDGNRLAYTAKPGEVNQDVYIIDDVEAALAAGGVDKGRRLTEFSSADANPSWSPDGEMLAFYRIEGGKEESIDLWVINVDGTGAKEIAKNIKRPSRGGPSWVPQTEVGHGRQLIYVVMATEGSKMFISDVASGETREVVVGARVISDVVASSGKSNIAFSAQDISGRKRIYAKKLKLVVEVQKKEWD